MGICRKQECFIIYEEIRVSLLNVERYPSDGICRTQECFIIYEEINVSLLNVERYPSEESRLQQFLLFVTTIAMNTMQQIKTPCKKMQQKNTHTHVPYATQNMCRDTSPLPPLFYFTRRVFVPCYDLRQPLTARWPNGLRVSSSLKPLSATGLVTCLAVGHVWARLETTSSTRDLRSPPRAGGPLSPNRRPASVWLCGLLWLEQLIYTFALFHYSIWFSCQVKTFSKSQLLI